MDQHLPIFVYGTLLTGFANYQRHVQPYPHQVFPAKVEGKIYHLPKGYPALIRKELEETRKDWVYGELLLFPPDVFAEVLEGLDRLEEYFAPTDSRNEYERELIKATQLATDKQYLAYTYIMRGRKELYAIHNGVLVKAGDWRQFQQR